MLPANLQAAGAAVLVVAVARRAALAGAPSVWKESTVNSVARRAWTEQAAAYLAANYQPGDGIIYSFGDLTGVLREAGIPLREGLASGQPPSWDAAVLRPDLFFHEEWALAIAGDKVDGGVARTGERGPHYELKKRIMVEGAPAVEIYQRQICRQPRTGSHEHPVYQSARRAQRFPADLARSVAGRISSDIAGAAVAICDRHTGMGADGWLLISRGTGATEDAAIELWNSDGSRSEISGNGTRCAAALLVESNIAPTRRAHRHRCRTQASASARAPWARLHFRNEYGRGVDRRTARIDRRAAIVRSSTSAIRSAFSLSTISISNGRRWARASSAIRGSRIAPMFPSCGWWITATRWTSAFSSAARGKP